MAVIVGSDIFLFVLNTLNYCVLKIKTPVKTPKPPTPVVEPPKEPTPEPEEEEWKVTPTTKPPPLTLTLCIVYRLLTSLRIVGYIHRLINNSMDTSN